MAEQWLQSGLEKIAIYRYSPSSAPELDLTPLEYRAVCAHLGFDRGNLAKVAENAGFSKVAAVAIVSEAVMEKEAVDPLSMGLGLGGGALLKSLWRPGRRVARGLGGEGWRRSGTALSREKILRELGGMKPKEQAKALREMAELTKTGPALGRSPATWSKADFAKVLGVGGLAGYGGHTIGKKVLGDEGGKKKGGVTVVST